MLPNGVQTTHSYDPADRLTALTHTHNGALLARYAYTLDATGNRTRVTETVSGVTREISYTYDSLYRLIAAEYSTGEAFAYQYDATGNRVAMTSTTPLSGTVITTYTFDAANRLTARAVSDGRAYTYTWSNRGQMLTEWTDGIPVRTFDYDGAGQMVRATVFTLTTEFVYNGLGARVALSVTGTTTRYTLDYAAGQRILAETTPTETVQYLYGHDCLGEFRDDEPLYYLPDAEGYVRQGVDADGAIISAWLFDPDGTVLEGPNGPVSHLICGGVYDWSTGLLYKGGRYFDPALGIWLVLLPLVVFQVWPGRKKRKGGYPWVASMCVGWITLMSVTACIRPTEVPKECIDLIPFEGNLGNHFVFANSSDCCPAAIDHVGDFLKWEKADMDIVETAMQTAMDKYTSVAGFGDSAWEKLGIASAPLYILRSSKHSSNPRAKAAQGGIGSWFFIFNSFFEPEKFGKAEPPEVILTHELAHQWDYVNQWQLNQEMWMWINWGDTPSSRANNKREEFAYAVTFYFWPEQDEHRSWTDDFGGGLVSYAVSERYGGRGRDGLRIRTDELLKDPIASREPAEMDDAYNFDITEPVYDRYDWLECKFTSQNCKP